MAEDGNKEIKKDVSGLRLKMHRNSQKDGAQKNGQRKNL